ncbi:MAG: corrinoid protein [Desulfobacterales bacterium]|nr:corrinoid protein [Desulfobacterales bacterium]
MAIQNIFDAVMEFKDSEIADIVQIEIDAGTDISVILNDGLIGAMDEVGKKFADGFLFVPEMLMAAQTMKAGLEVVRPYLSETDAKPRGTVIIGTVKGDLHDIGKNLVAMMLEGAGFKIVDLGVDVEPAAFFDAAKENRAELVAMSALLTTTMPAMEECVKLFKNAGLDTKLIIGGAPVTQAYADKINSDGYSADAPGAVELTRKLIPRA